MTLLDLRTLLAAYRYSWTNEDDLQRGVAAVLDQAGIEYERERHISSGSRPDFLVEATAIEVKVKCSQSDVLRQLHRYAEHDAVEAVLLLTPSLRLRVPPTLCGKPAAVCRVPQL